MYLWTEDHSVTASRNRKADPEKNRRKSRDWRAKMHARGLRPVQLWLPDTRSEAFRAEARRQMELLARSPQAAEDQAWVDAISINLDALP
jgi:hypothetical protein